MIKVRSILQNITLVLLSIFTTIGFVEIGSRWLDFTFYIPTNSIKDFRSAVPPPYRSLPYDIKEYFNSGLNNLNWENDPEYGSLPKDFRSPFVNVKDRRRVTTDAPINSTRTIHIFGGSTVMCLETPDFYTFPSYLQRLINKEVHEPTQVINYGSSGITSTHQLFRLKNTANIQAGDIVIFLMV